MDEVNFENTTEIPIIHYEPEDIFDPMGTSNQTQSLMNQELGKPTPLSAERKPEETIILEEQKVETVDPKTSNYNVSILDKYGENYTQKQYITNPAIARDEEIKKLILVLLTPEKSAILVGKPGIGKTAIVEGLSYRIINNDVPDVLKGYQVINVNVSSMIGEVNNDEETQTKIQLMIDELKERPKTILFIDEIHTLVGTEAADFANMIKPAVDRGDVKMIGATTSDEYERYILRDRAFVRRFEKIDVEEPDEPTTVKILMGSLKRIEVKTGVTMNYTDFIKERIMKFIVTMTSEYKRVYGFSSRYPDICLALVSMMYSEALFENSKEVKFRHIYKALQECKSIYEDSLKKELERFQIEFKQELEEEHVQIDANNQLVVES